MSLDLDAIQAKRERRPITPGHPIVEGAGYDCCCGQCLALEAPKEDQ